MPQRSLVSRLFEFHSRDVIGFNSKETEIQMKISCFGCLQQICKAVGCVQLVQKVDALPHPDDISN